VSHQISYLRGAVVDLRANLETILLNVAALDACVEQFGYDPDVMLIQEAARYIDAVRELHKAGGVLLRVVDGALASVIAS
jgi:hypothetical protein